MRDRMIKSMIFWRSEDLKVTESSSILLVDPTPTNFLRMLRRESGMALERC